jgi:hypothetical protein
MRINPNLRAMKYLLYWNTILVGEGVFSCQLKRYGREHTSPSSFTSFQLRGVELTTSFEYDALLLETSVASEARGFLEAHSRLFKVFASESEETRGSRVSDLRLGASW